MRTACSRFRRIRSAAACQNQVTKSTKSSHARWGDSQNRRGIITTKCNLKCSKSTMQCIVRVICLTRYKLFEGTQDHRSNGILQARQLKTIGGGWHHKGIYSSIHENRIQSYFQSVWLMETFSRWCLYFSLSGLTLYMVAVFEGNLFQQEI